MLVPGYVAQRPEPTLVIAAVAVGVLLFLDAYRVGFDHPIALALVVAVPPVVDVRFFPYQYGQSVLLSGLVCLFWALRGRRYLRKFEPS